MTTAATVAIRLANTIRSVSPQDLAFVNPQRE
jgi:hypothetical protein